MKQPVRLDIFEDLIKGAPPSAPSEKIPKRLPDCCDKPTHRRVLTYNDIALTRKTWSTFSPERLAQYKRDIFRYYRRVGFPYHNMTIDEKQQEYNNVRECDHAALLSDDGIIKQTFHGSALAWCYHPHSLSVKCGTRRSVIETFEDDRLFKKAISKLVDFEEAVSDSAIRSLMKKFQWTGSVSNFRATAAAAVYHHLLPENGGTVYDPSAGFGGRLLGAMICGRVEKYIATDPSTASLNGCQQMANELNNRRIPIQLVKCGSENFRPDPLSVDLVFTSPPYFDTEKYSDEPTQSFIKFSNQEQWLNGFMLHTLKNCHYGLKSTGVLAINIANVSSYPTLEKDFVKLATKNGFKLVCKLRLAMSIMMGTRHSTKNSIALGTRTSSSDIHKYEPVFVFEKS